MLILQVDQELLLQFQKGGSPGLDTEVISDMWKETLGVEVEIQQVEWATYLQDMNRKRLQLWLVQLASRLR